MLKFASEMDKDTRIKCLLAGWLAVDENCGELNPESSPIRLRKSNGRRKAGRPTKYYIIDPKSPPYPTIEAYTDAEALEIANQTIGGS